MNDYSTLAAVEYIDNEDYLERWSTHAKMYMNKKAEHKILIQKIQTLLMVFLCSEIIKIKIAIHEI